jgi:hypothetical protein
MKKGGTTAARVARQRECLKELRAIGLRAEHAVKAFVERSRGSLARALRRIVSVLTRTAAGANARRNQKPARRRAGGRSTTIAFRRLSGSPTGVKRKTFERARPVPRRALLDGTSVRYRA